MKNTDQYNEDYYERGLETGSSAYQNYRWMWDLTIPMAMTIIDLLSIKREDKILDYGCAKGYLVKALRVLYRQAWGTDVSDYALENAYPDIKNYCFKSEGLISKNNIPIDFPDWFDWCIAKDVFEHVPECDLKKTLEGIPADKMFVVVPLGENGKYYAPANNLDKTHVICEPAEWWENRFEDSSWDVSGFTYRIKGIKDSYYPTVQKAHGFFILKRKKQ